MRSDTGIAMPDEGGGGCTYLDDHLHQLRPHPLRIHPTLAQIAEESIQRPFVSLARLCVVIGDKRFALLIDTANISQSKPRNDNTIRQYIQRVV